MKSKSIGMLLLATLVVAGSFTLHAVADTYSAPAGVPRLLPFRGHLESGGLAVTTETTASFELWSAATGGSLLWGPETHTFTPADGAFAILLGASTPLPASVLSGGDAYVQVRIGGVLLAGRQRLGSVPYALRSDVAANGAPPGSVMPFAGETVPEGWLACDGRALDADDDRYAPLFAAIGTAWGDGSTGDGAMAGVTDFNAPDLRGRFLRGQDEGTGRDPDAAARVASAAGGAAMDRVGSVQGHQFASHNHGGGNHTHNHGSSHNNSAGMYHNDRGYLAGGDISRVTGNYAIRTSGTIITTQGGPETRPLNASVRFIIKM